MKHKFMQYTRRLDEPIQREICDPITENNIDKLEVEMMIYEDSASQEMKQAEPEASIMYTYDVPNPEKKWKISV